MDRRSFLRGVLAAGAAAVLPSMRSDSMRCDVPAAIRWDMGTGKDRFCLAHIRLLREEIERAMGMPPGPWYVVVPERTVDAMRRRGLLHEINGRPTYEGAIVTTYRSTWV